MTLLRSLTNPNGRIGRMQYLKAFAMLVILQIILDFIFGTIQESLDMEYMSLEMIFFSSIPSFITGILFIMPNITRLHDTNRSGWFQLIGFIPIVNLYLFYVLFFQKGTEGANQYGEDPLKNLNTQN